MSLQISEEEPEFAPQSIDVSPLTINTGAEISGVDLTRPLPKEQIRDIRAALLKWRVIFFRDQVMTHAQHIDFARQFGELTPGHAVYGSDSEYPEIYPISKNRSANHFREQVRHRPWTGWHCDITAAHQWLRYCAVILCRRMEAIRSLQTSWLPIMPYRRLCRTLYVVCGAFSVMVWPTALMCPRNMPNK